MLFSAPQRTLTNHIHLLANGAHSLDLFVTSGWLHESKQGGTREGRSLPPTDHTNVIRPSCISNYLLPLFKINDVTVTGPHSVTHSVGEVIRTCYVFVTSDVSIVFSTACNNSMPNGILQKTLELFILVTKEMLLKSDFEFIFLVLLELFHLQHDKYNSWQRLLKTGNLWK